MKRYYRNRFILGAMLSFLILLIVAMIGTWLFSYRQMEQETNDFLSAMQQVNAEDRSFTQPVPPPMFGYTPDRRDYPSGFYDIDLDQEGNIRSIQRLGMMEEDDDSVREYVRQALQQQAASGKVGPYKYSLVKHEDGTSKLVLLDISIQLQGLYNTLKSALLVGAVLMAALFLILLPVSSKVADAFVRNTEKQKQFITDAGHDLKTPVAIIRSNLDVMELQGKSKWSENIRSQTERLERLISELLMMSRLDETSEKIKREALDLTVMLQDEKQHFLPVTQQRDISWQVDIPDTLPVMGDEKTVRQMLDLLLDNAAQYTDEGGEIRINGQADKKKVRVELMNTVESLPKVSAEDLTERFVRGNTARTQKSGGAGIGLSAAKRIAEMHRGTLAIRYQGDHMFCVSVELPRQL